MAAAIFALIGTLLGISGTLLVETRRSRMEVNRSRREALRTSCAEFTGAIVRTRELTLKWKSQPSDASLRESASQAHHEAWVHYELLRLISASKEVQEAGRHLMRYAWGLMRQVDGKPPREDEQPDGPFALTLEWLPRFTIAARRELGVPQADDIYMEPPEWRVPDPTASSPS